jgi:hypothetical protein
MSLEDVSEEEWSFLQWWTICYPRCSSTSSWDNFQCAVFFPLDKDIDFFIHSNLFQLKNLRWTPLFKVFNQSHCCVRGFFFYYYYFQLSGRDWTSQNSELIFRSFSRKRKSILVCKQLSGRHFNPWPVIASHSFSTTGNFFANQVVLLLLHTYFRSFFTWVKRLHYFSKFAIRFLLSRVIPFGKGKCPSLTLFIVCMFTFIWTIEEETW